jgi:hypothetical protein
MLTTTPADNLPLTLHRLRSTHFAPCAPAMPAAMPVASNVGYPLLQHTHFCSKITWHFGGWGIALYEDVAVAILKIELIEIAQISTT